MRQDRSESVSRSAVGATLERDAASSSRRTVPQRTAAPIAAPSAPERPARLERHGDVRIDPWYWLNERDGPEVRAHLDAENEYLETALAGVASLRTELEAELASRVAPEESTAPYHRAGAWYYSRYEAGAEYELFCRRVGSPDAPEQILLDGNELARGHAHFHLAPPVPSPAGRFLAFAIDSVGRRFYTVRVVDLASGELLADRIENVTDDFVWANDEATLFYARQDPETLRSCRVYRHRLGSDPERDPVVFEEADEAFWVSLTRFRSGRFLAIRSAQTLTTEYRVLDADRPEGEFRVVEPRLRGREYELDHQPGASGGRFLILTNDAAPDFRLMSAPAATPGRDHWTERIGAREGVLLEQVQAFTDAIAVRERVASRGRIRLLAGDGAPIREVSFEENAFVVTLDPMAEIGGPLRLSYSSPTTPRTLFEEDLTAGRRRVRHRAQVAGPFSPASYRCERIWAPARDGRSIPVTLLARATAAPAGTAPLLLTGYGAYGLSYDPAFNANLLSLVDRGFIFAIAHVRGGSELGRAWCDGGRRLAKRNTFHDFVDAAEHLASSGWGDPARLYAMGGSAGGLLIGAVLNERPDLFHGAIANVPFVDILTTMLDTSIPLTTGEYDEWGDPNDPAVYDYIKSYSPYDNVGRAAYPHLLAMTGFHDSQVQYWEPAKWVAKLRSLRLDRSRLLLLRTNFEAGHAGSSGRYRRLADTAIQYAFLLRLAALDEGEGRTSRSGDGALPAGDEAPASGAG